MLPKEIMERLYKAKHEATEAYYYYKLSSELKAPVRNAMEAEDAFSFALKYINEAIKYLDEMEQVSGETED
ncbi:hypothetical protein [Ligilactobacillus saerimneri]|uniref:hypothetical protein n=1 Tax=Ligilactobacillus saerimneri TaxID=228229 RepID=UPI0024B9C2E6|nr:hypothetical protein [Ligilactobacillus saerimneri]